MSGRTLYIESSAPDDSPCVCSNCNWVGALKDLDSATDGVLEAGDPSFAGRCPDCDSVAYLDRTIDKAMDAVSHIEWTLEKGYPVGDSNLIRAADILGATLSALRPDARFTILVTDAEITSTNHRPAKMSAADAVALYRSATNNAERVRSAAAMAAVLTRLALS